MQNHVTLIRENEILVDNGVAPIVDADNGTPIYLYGAKGEYTLHDLWLASIGYGFTKSEMQDYVSRIQDFVVDFKNYELDASAYGADIPTGMPIGFDTYENDFISVKRVTANGLPLFLLAQRDSIKIGYVAGYAATNPFPNDFYISSDNGENMGSKEMDKWNYISWSC